MHKVLVTGDRGYIGSVLVPFLLGRGYEVTGFDTDYYSQSSDPHRTPPAYKTVRKDIRLIEQKDIDGVDSIIHLSALSNDPMGNMDGALTEQINFRSTVRLGEMARESGVRRFLFSSSCSIYGISKEGIVTESSPVNPLTAYAQSKMNSEKELARLATPNFFVGLMRNSTVYGYSPNFRDDLVVNNLVVSAVLTGELKIMSDGTPWRPLIDVRDLGTIFRKFLEIHDDALNGHVVNIGFNENNFQVNDIVHLILEQVPSLKVRYTGQYGTDTRSYKVSFDLLHRMIPDIIQEWPLRKSIADLILQVERLDRKKLKSNAYTRLHILQELVASKKIDQSLFWK